MHQGQEQGQGQALPPHMLCAPSQAPPCRLQVRIRARMTHTNMFLPATRLRCSSIPTVELLQRFGQEAHIMQQLRHPNIVLLLGVSATRSGDLCLVTELLARGVALLTTSSPAAPHTSEAN